MDPGYFSPAGSLTFLASRRLGPAPALMRVGKVFSTHRGLDQARMVVSFSIINPTSQQEKTSCVPYRRGTFGLSGSDPELNLRERPAEPAERLTRGRGGSRGAGLCG